MGMIGFLLLITAVSQLGLNWVGFAAGLADEASFGPNFRFGFYPACTVVRVMADRRR